jgi:hypothetical protein
MSTEQHFGGIKLPEVSAALNNLRQTRVHLERIIALLVAPRLRLAASRLNSVAAASGERCRMLEAWIDYWGCRVAAMACFASDSLIGVRSMGPCRSL